MPLSDVQQDYNSLPPDQQQNTTKYMLDQYLKHPFTPGSLENGVKLGVQRLGNTADNYRGGNPNQAYNPANDYRNRYMGAAGPVSPVFANNFMYGGRVGGAQDEYNRQLGLMSQARNMNLDPGLLSSLQGAAYGNQGPSAAQAQLQQGRDVALQNAAALANSARGNPQNLAAAQAAGAQQGMMATQQAANAAAQLRAQEVQQARGQLAGYVLGQGGLSGQQQLAYNQAGLGVMTNQQQAMSDYERLMSQNYNSAMGYATQKDINAANNQAQMMQNIIGGVAGAATGGLSAVAMNAYKNQQGT